MVSSGIGKLFMHICIIQEYRIYLYLLLTGILNSWVGRPQQAPEQHRPLSSSDPTPAMSVEASLRSSPASGKGQYVATDQSFLFSLNSPTGSNVRNFDNIWCRSDLFVANNWRQGKYFSQKIYCIDYNILPQV